MVFERLIPTDNDLVENYSKYCYSEATICPESTRVSYRKILKTFSKWRGDKRLLDIGCGQGDFLWESRLQGWVVSGIEFDRDAVNANCARGLSVAHGASASEAYKGFIFDVITAFEVIEHLRLPGDLLKNAAVLLPKGGLLYLTTPNFNSITRFLDGYDNKDLFCWPDHLCFFTSASLRRLARQHGFSVVRVRTTGIDPLQLKRSLGYRVRNYFVNSIWPTHSKKNDSSVPSNLSLPEQSKREELRSLSYFNFKYSLLKSIVNCFLNAFGVGDTLKVWLVKL